MKQLVDFEPEQQLDIVLVELNNQKVVTDWELKKVFKTKGIETEGLLLVAILNKLVNDGFAHVEVRESNKTSILGTIPLGGSARYKITFEGKSLLRINGGYAGRLSDERNASRLVK